MEPTGVAGDPGAPSQADLAVLQRCAHGLKFVGTELGRLVQLTDHVHAAMTTLSFQLAIEAAAVGQRVLRRLTKAVTEVINRFTAWLSRHVQFKFGFTFQLGRA